MAQKSKEAGQAPIDDRTLEIIHEYILGVSDVDSDLREPHLRPSLVESYKFVIFAFCLQIAVGFVVNAVVFLAILKYKLYKDATFAFVLNNTICDLVKCVFVLPLSVYVLLVQNWVLGECMCSFLPMIQDIPMHVTTLTYTLMAWDRLRFIKKPYRPRLPAFVCCFGTWLSAMCLVLPYPLYIIYIDLGTYVAELDGVGLCIYNLVDNMEEYMRGIFLTMYVAPMCLVSYFYIRTSQELKNCGNSSSVNGGLRTSTGGHISGHRPLRREIKNANASLNSHRDCDDDTVSFPKRPFRLDIFQEKMNQRYLIFTALVYGICLCPIMVLRLARFALVETYDNSGILDMVYTIFVWIAFAPVCITPLIHLIWQLSSSSNVGLRNYFHCGGKNPKHTRDSFEVLDSEMNDSFRKRFNLDKPPVDTRSSSLMDGADGS
ncbi:probable G-protein coupled receptor 83 [Harmonia axyridis]|uniref:probable G-protein coupled receptor 83 n=1 Tax=Harmonia axyridis TaxID=115357 RepID=UPI001E278ADC|nr:probable G-protein coupled receptor 83 [Harmonia axyridis]